MDTKKIPYELLIRWSQSGSLAGAHVQYRYVIRDGEKIIGESVSNAEPISTDTSGKFPLGEILDGALVTALADLSRERSETDRLRTDLAEAQGTIADLRCAITDLSNTLRAATEAQRQWRAERSDGRAH